MRRSAARTAALRRTRRRRDVLRRRFDVVQSAVNERDAADRSWDEVRHEVRAMLPPPRATTLLPASLFSVVVAFFKATPASSGSPRPIGRRGQSAHVSGSPRANFHGIRSRTADFTACLLLDLQLQRGQ